MRLTFHELYRSGELPGVKVSAGSEAKMETLEKMLTTEFVHPAIAPLNAWY